MCEISSHIRKKERTLIAIIWRVLTVRQICYLCNCLCRTASDATNAMILLSTSVNIYKFVYFSHLCLLLDDGLLLLKHSIIAGSNRNLLL
jgi:hypothetical protein